MVILYSEEFVQRLEYILDFISKDSKSRSDAFLNDLRSKIKNIPFMPYGFRKNNQLNQENVRDLIFKGYVIPFEISDGCIEILSIYKSNLWKP
ncbi:MAG: plasmid stabilization protein [Proteobacteria bacterium]|nr:MAG: plasmid stabilization protein [Pseudomonadota bacterium]